MIQNVPVCSAANNHSAANKIYYTDSLICIVSEKQVCNLKCNNLKLWNDKRVKNSCLPPLVKDLTQFNFLEMEKKRGKRTVFRIENKMADERVADHVIQNVPARSSASNRM